MMPLKKSWPLSVRHRNKTILRLLTFALIGLSACASSAKANNQNSLVSEFEKSCIGPAKTGQVAFQDDQARGWVKVDRDTYEPLNAYTGLVYALLEDTLGQTAEFRKNVNGTNLYLIRYAYDGLYGQTAHNCIVSDFERDSWQFPSEFNDWMRANLKVTKFSSAELEGQKAVGNWFAKDSVKPINKVHVSAIPEDSLDAREGGFFGTILQSIRMEKTETTE